MVHRLPRIRVWSIAATLVVVALLTALVAPVQAAVPATHSPVVPLSEHLRSVPLVVITATSLDTAGLVVTVQPQQLRGVPLVMYTATAVDTVGNVAANSTLVETKQLRMVSGRLLRMPLGH